MSTILGKLAQIFYFRDRAGVPLVWRGAPTTLFNAQVINNTTYTPSGSYIDCRAGNKISVEITATFSGNPTSFEVIALFRRRGQTSWQEYRMGEWNYLSYSKTEIDAITAPVADTVRENLTIDAISDEFSVALLGTGTAVGNTFTVTITATDIKV